MKREAKLLLVLGCAGVLLLELPGTFACLAAGWNGPYAEPSPSGRAFAGAGDAARAFPGAVGCIDLARR